MFKRPGRPAPTQQSESSSTANVAVTKGKATPKRSEAQAARKISAIGSQQGRVRGGRNSARLTPEQTRAKREAMRRGDPSVMSPRDRGPARAYARDYIDARRNVLGLFVPVAVPTIILGYSHVKSLMLVASIVLYSYVLGSIVDTLWTSRAIRKRVAVRFPDEPTKGIAVYAAMRALQFRRMRLPGPRVSRGAKI